MSSLDAGAGQPAGPTKPGRRPDPGPGPFGTVAEILDYVRELHEGFAGRFRAAACAIPDYRQQALMSYLAELESGQLAALGRLLASGDESLGAFVQSVPTAALLAARIPPEDVSFDFDVEVERYRRRDAALIQLYDQLAGSGGARPRKRFRELAALVRRNQTRLREALIDA